MRNLKRVLSLTLASVMLLGMMVIGSSAAEAKKINFTDAGEIEYNEAVDIMVALGVLEGNPDGSFSPKGTLTREAAAKIICYMLLGEENAEKLTANKDVFKDVAANRWSAGYISYCVERSILAGTGNGNFNPTGELTGVAFGKMLLVSLGYDPAIQGYVGSNWALTVAADMVDAGIAPSGVLLNAPMTREQAAQTAYQTLTADMVYYASKGTTVNTTDGTTVIVGASEPASVTDRSGDDYRDTDPDTYQQFCEKYFPKLKLVDDNDNYGRPGGQWKYKGGNITFKVDDAAVTYTSKVEAKDVKKDLKNYKVDSTDGVTPETDGNPGTKRTAKEADGPNNDLIDDIVAASGKGVAVTVYVDEDDFITDVVAINTYFGKVNKVAEKDGETTATITRLTKGAPTGDNSNTFKTAAFEKDDYVIYTVGEDGIESMALAEAQTGKITATSGTKYLRLDGTKYDYNVKAAAEDKNSVEAVELGDATIYMDTYGNVIYVGKVEGAADQFLYVKGADKYFDTISIRVVYADGTTKVVTLDGDTKADFTTDSEAIVSKDATVAGNVKKISDASDTELIGLASEISSQVYAYTEEGTDVVKLDVNSRIGSSQGTAKIEKDSNKVVNMSNANTVYATTNTSTIFVMTGSGKTYTGYREVPNLNDVTMIPVNNKNSTIAGIIFVTSSEEGDSENAFWFFLAKDAKAEKGKDDDGKTVYTFSEKAYVDGEETEIVVTDSVNTTINNTPGLYRAQKVNDKDQVTGLGDADKFTANDQVCVTLSALQANEATDVGGDTLIVNGVKWMYDDNTQFVLVADDLKSASLGSASDIIEQDDTADRGSNITYVYVAEAKGSTAGSKDASTAKVVYIIQGEKQTGAKEEVTPGGGNTPSADQIKDAIAGSNADTVTLPSNVTLPSSGAIEVPTGKTLELTADQLNGTSNSFKGNVDLSKVDVPADKPITAESGANIEIKSTQSAVTAKAGSTVTVGNVSGTGKVEATGGTGTTTTTTTTVNINGSVPADGVETKGGNVNIVIGADATVADGSIKITGTAGTVNIASLDNNEVPASALNLTGASGAIVVKINGNLVALPAPAPAAYRMARTGEPAGLTIPANYKVTVTGNVEADAVVVIQDGGELTVNGTVKRGASITTKSQTGFKVGPSASVMEAITLDLDSTDGVELDQIVQHIVYKVSDASAESYAWPDDIDEHTVLVNIKTGAAPDPEGTNSGHWNAYAMAEGSTTKLFDTTMENVHVGSLGMQCWYYSLTEPTGGNDDPLDTNPTVEGTYYTVTITDGTDTTHTCGFTAWAGESATPAN